MSKILMLFLVVVIHYIADFIFQDEKWATNKSKDNKSLLTHTFTYSIITLIGWNLLFDGLSVYNQFIVFGFTWSLHTLTDYITSRIVSRKFFYKELGSPIPNFGAFSMIGMDQVFHYGQLFFMFYYITELSGV